jgi:hypothetical protein
MRKVVIFAVSFMTLGIIAHVTPASAEKKRCDAQYAKCTKGTKAGSDAEFQCTVKFNNCVMSRSSNPFGPFRSCTPGRGCRDAGDTGDGKTRSKPSKGKGSKFADDGGGWNGKYTTVVIRDKTGTYTITVKQGVPTEIGLMVLGPDGAKHHIWDLKLAAQLEALGLTVVYANDNTAREAYAKAKARMDAAVGGGKKITTRGDGSKIDQATLNGSGANTKGLLAGGKAGGTALNATKTDGAAAKPPRTATSPTTTNTGVVKPVVIPGPVSNNNRRQAQ